MYTIRQYGMNAQYIADEINKKVKHIGIKDKPNLQLSEKYGYWTIGITNDLDRRKGEHANTKNVEHWRGWPADTENIARVVEKYFLDRGMNGGGGGGTSPNSVYIF